MAKTQGESITFTEQDSTILHTGPGVALEYTADKLLWGNEAEKRAAFHNVTAELVLAADGILASGDHEAYVSRQYDVRLETIASTMAACLFKPEVPYDQIPGYVPGAGPSSAIQQPYGTHSASYVFRAREYPGSDSEHLRGKRMQALWLPVSDRFVFGVFDDNDLIDQPIVTADALAGALDDPDFRDIMGSERQLLVREEQPYTLPTMRLLRTFNDTESAPRRTVQLGALQELIHSLPAEEGLVVSPLTVDNESLGHPIASARATIYNQEAAMGLYVFAYAAAIRRQEIHDRLTAQVVAGNFVATAGRKRFSPANVSSVGLDILPFFRHNDEWRGIPQSTFVIPDYRRADAEQLAAVQTRVFDAILTAEG